MFSEVLADSTAMEANGPMRPKFGADGLLTAVAQNAKDGTILMLAHMNETALQLTLETGFAHFWSRSRNVLWKKGESSGNMLKVEQVLVDCDQDAIVLKVSGTGAEAACHTGLKSCFFREVNLEGDQAILSTAD